MVSVIPHHRLMQLVEERLVDQPRPVSGRRSFFPNAWSSGCIFTSVSRANGLLRCCPTGRERGDIASAPGGGQAAVGDVGEGNPRAIWPASSPCASPARLHHIGVGRTYTGTRVLVLIQDLNIRIIHAATGQLLRELTLNPTKDYQPT